MKKAKIKPSFKKVDRQDIQNYRPILSVLSKPLEKLRYNRLLLFLERHNIQGPAEIPDEFAKRL
jgi:hypothetical protein